MPPLRKWAATLADLREQLYALLLFVRYVVFRSRASSTAATQFSLGDKRSVLVISYYAPPYRSMYGTQRVAKFVKYLVKLGWKVTLLTTIPSVQDERSGHEEEVPNGVHVVRLPPLQRQSAFIRKGLLVPDDFVRWIRPATAEAAKLIRERALSLVLATAPPYSNLVVGAVCASRCGVPFVPDFRDPWSKIDLSWVIDKPVLRQLNRWMEKVVLRASTRIVIADDLIHVKSYLALDDQRIERRVVSITNGYDEDDFRDVATTPACVRAHFTISYAGVIYDRKTFATLLAPFLIWQQRYPKDLEHVLLIYAGPHSFAFHEAEPLPFNFLDKGYVSHREAIELRMNSDLQLFYLPSYFKPHVYSGKIFEMLRAGVPILAITNPEGAVAKLLERTNAGVSVAPTLPELAADELKSAFDRWRSGDRSAQANSSAIAAYSRESLTAKLSDVLLEAVEDPTSSSK